MNSYNLFMIVTRNISLPENFEVSIRQLCSYWEKRDMKFIQCSETHLIGKRGNLLGNFFSFNMKHLIARIEIKRKNDCLGCILSINTVMQYITEANHDFFVLELETFEKYLLFNDLNQKAWQKQRQDSKQQSISFILYCFLSGFGGAIIIALFF